MDYMNILLFLMRTRCRACFSIWGLKVRNLRLLLACVLIVLVHASLFNGMSALAEKGSDASVNLDMEFGASVHANAPGGSHHISWWRPAGALTESDILSVVSTVHAGDRWTWFSTDGGYIVQPSTIVTFPRAGTITIATNRPSYPSSFVIPVDAGTRLMVGRQISMYSQWGVVMSWTGVNLITLDGIPNLLHLNEALTYCRLVQYTYHRYEGPVVTAGWELEKSVGDEFVPAEGVTGRWYFSPSKLIPTDGSITSLNIKPVIGTFPMILGNKYTGIGVLTETVELIDGERLSGIYPADNSSTLFDRKIFVKTGNSPDLEITYGPTSKYPDGTTLSGVIYDSTGMLLPCGGEDGWTNQQLRGEVFPNSIMGTFRTDIRMGTLTANNNSGGIATLNYHTNTTVADRTLGTLVRGVLTQRGDSTVELSEAVTGRVKIDRQNPVANVNYHGGLNFTDNSTDALSGISQLRPTKIALVVGTATPADSDYYELSSHPPVANGNYRLWVWATDKAGNEHKVRRNTSLYISGEVNITKDTEQGATLHNVHCQNPNSINVESDCEVDCIAGAQPDILENSQLTYQLVLSNTDTTTTATGTFIDYLPEGCVVDTLPTWVLSGASGSITNLSFDLGGVGSGYEGQYRVMGDYTLAGGASILVDINSIAPSYNAVVSADKIISNQASLTWTIGSFNGNNLSNFANHRIYVVPHIEKYANWGAATHVDSCTNANNLEIGSGCDSECSAGNSGYVQSGDILSYQLTFDNPSNILQYFATNGGARNYDVFLPGVDATNQTITIDLVDAGGTRTNQFTGTVAPEIGRAHV